MVTLSVSHIFWGVVSVIMVVLWFFVVRFFRRNDEQHAETKSNVLLLGEKIEKMRSELDHLLGEHETLCKTHVRRKK